MDKVIVDGKVAVLYSPGFGAGWYSWNTGIEECLFCPEIVELIRNEPERGWREKRKASLIKQITDIAETKWEGGYWGGARDLTIKWVPQGEQFEITEYDGSESLNIIGECKYLVA